MALKPMRFGLGAILWLCCSWAGLLAVLAWWRQPAPSAALPERIQWRGQWLERQSGAIAAAQLPEAVIPLAGAHYQGRDGSRLLLRWLAHASSGNGVGFDLKATSAKLLGEGRLGVCRVVDPRSGTLVGVAQNDAELQALLRTTNPKGFELAAWALGLRGWRNNRCLFVGEVSR